MWFVSTDAALAQKSVHRRGGVKQFEGAQALANKDHIASGVLLQIAGRVMSDYLEAAAGQSGLTAPQLSLLGMVARFPGHPQLAYGQMLVFNKMSTSRYAAQLEERGLIDRRRGDLDRREMRLYPTQEGSALFETLKRRLEKTRAEMEARAAPEGYAELELQVRRFLHNEGWVLTGPATPP